MLHLVSANDDGYIYRRLSAPRVPINWYQFICRRDDSKRQRGHHHDHECANEQNGANRACDEFQHFPLPFCGAIRLVSFSAAQARCWPSATSADIHVHRYQRLLRPSMNNVSSSITRHDRMPPRAPNAMRAGSLADWPDWPSLTLVAAAAGHWRKPAVVHNDLLSDGMHRERNLDWANRPLRVPPRVKTACVEKVPGSATIY